MKKNHASPDRPRPLVGILGLGLLILWIAYLGGLTQLVILSLNLRPDSLVWFIAFPFIFPVSPLVAFFLFDVWLPLGVTIALPLISALAFWWEGRHVQ